MRALSVAWNPKPGFQTMWGLINDEHVQRGWGQMKEDAILSNAAFKHCTDIYGTQPRAWPEPHR